MLLKLLHIQVLGNSGRAAITSWSDFLMVYWGSETSQEVLKNTRQARKELPKVYNPYARSQMYLDTYIYTWTRKEYAELARDCSVGIMLMILVPFLVKEFFPMTMDGSVIMPWHVVHFLVYFTYGIVLSYAIILGNVFASVPLSIYYGYPCKKSFNGLEMSRCVSEFWTRWNLPVQTCLKRVAYDPFVQHWRLPKPIGVLNVFFVSGLYHELIIYGLGPAAGTQWVQLRFFLIHGVWCVCETAVFRFCKASLGWDVLNSTPRWILTAYTLTAIVCTSPIMLDPYIKNEVLNGILWKDPVLDWIQSSYSCKVCTARYDTLADKKLHLKTAWHLKNQSRFLAGLGPITETAFADAVASQLPASDESSVFECLACNKRFKSRGMLDSHRNSRKHLEQTQSKSDKTVASVLANSQDDAATAHHCLFCVAAFATQALRDDHLLQTHSFYAGQTTPQLLDAIQELVVLDCICPHCLRAFDSVDSCWHHIETKGHAQIDDDLFALLGGIRPEMVRPAGSELVLSDGTLVCSRDTRVRRENRVRIRDLIPLALSPAEKEEILMVKKSVALGMQIKEQHVLKAQRQTNICALRRPR
ncbi:hypothetical protein HDU91_005751 [Kappamyces sp. JEL0680]|nr:hypothetical protein HDU91_005751 [Kappamyces sp. JEL0680]